MTDRTTLGGQMHALVERLYPLCRSITGNGVRATLDVLAESIPLTVHEIPTGTAVLDWTVPKEWNIRDAYVADPEGQRVIDFTKSNLHVVGYSVPVRTRMSLAALREHLHTLPEQPDLVPYRTSYYKEAWGFCLSQNTLDSLPDTEYEVVIDSTLADGSLTYAEHVVSGQVSDEVLVSCHVCHPSLANDNLAAIAVAVRARQAAGSGSAVLHLPFPVRPWNNRRDHVPMPAMPITSTRSNMVSSWRAPATREH